MEYWVLAVLQDTTTVYTHASYSVRAMALGPPPPIYLYEYLYLFGNPELHLAPYEDPSFFTFLHAVA
jgi:hypothetical protein